MALTAAGESLAEQLGWRVCVVSMFFATVLDASLDEQVTFDIAYVLPRDGVAGLRPLVDAPCLPLCPELDGSVDGYLA